MKKHFVIRQLRRSSKLMNRSLLCLRFSERAVDAELIGSLCSSYPDLFSPESLAPSFAEEASEHSTSAESLTSSISRVSKGQAQRIMLSEVLASPLEHKVFTVLEGEDCEQKNWLYWGPDGLTGPLPASRMDELFFEGVIGEKTQIRNKFEENPVDFAQVVSRYLRKSDKVFPESANPFARGVGNFYRGQAPKRRALCLETFKHQASSKVEAAVPASKASNIFSLGFFASERKDSLDAQASPRRIVTRLRAQTAN